MPELTNLLPRDKVRLESRDYFFRLIALSALLLLVVVFIHTLLLFPSYLYLSEEVKTREAHLAGLASSVASSEEEAVSMRLSALASQGESLLLLSETPSAVSTVNAVLSVPHEGVRVRGVSISRPEAGEPEMRVRGIAATREALQRYHRALSSLPFVTNADLPLSVYAEEADITFSITLSGPLSP